MAAPIKSSVSITRTNPLEFIPDDFKSTKELLAACESAAKYILEDEDRLLDAIRLREFVQDAEVNKTLLLDEYLDMFDPETDVLLKDKESEYKLDVSRTKNPKQANAICDLLF